MKENVKAKLQEFTHHKYVEITNRCNASLFYALFVAKKLDPRKKIAIPNQGGWLKYKTYAEILEFEVIEYPTEDCTIDVPALLAMKDECGAILITNPGGYIARQPLNELYLACSGGPLIIEDVSGSLGNYCDNAHIKIGSFGKWKPISIGYGGFISFEKEEHFILAKEIMTTSKVGPDFYELLERQLENVKERYQQIFLRSRQIKKDLNKFTILKRDEDGLVVMVAFQHDSEKEAIVRYCTEHSLDYTVCPRSIRTLQTAISIEVKRS